MGYSIVLGTGSSALQVKVKPFPSPRIIPALSWAQDTAGNWHVTDRTANQDVHEADAVMFGTKSEMEILANWIEASGREKFVISDFDGTFFAPLVDHTQDVECTFLNLGRMRQAFFAPDSGVYELSATFRALAPAWVSTTPSLESLRLQQGFEADKSTEVRKAFFYDTNVFAVDDRSDSGRFVGTFRQRKSEAEAILRYLLHETRAQAFAFPELPGVDYPFGKAHGALPKQCLAKSISVFRVNLKVWEIKIEFVEQREIV